jgi:prephenate dehydratase
MMIGIRLRLRDYASTSMRGHALLSVYRGLINRSVLPMSNTLELLGRSRGFLDAITSSRHRVTPCGRCFLQMSKVPLSLLEQDLATLQAVVSLSQAIAASLNHLRLTLVILS